MDDFEHALTEVVPAFGAATEALAGYRMHGIINYGSTFDHLMATLRALVAQVSQRGAGGAAVSCPAACNMARAMFGIYSRDPHLMAALNRQSRSE